MARILEDLWCHWRKLSDYFLSPYPPYSTVISVAHLLCFVFFSFATCLFTESGAFAICSKRTSRDRHVRIWPTICVKQPPNVTYSVQNFHNTKTLRIKAFLCTEGEKTAVNRFKKKIKEEEKISRGPVYIFLCKLGILSNSCVPAA